MKKTQKRITRRKVPKAAKKPSLQQRFRSKVYLIKPWKFYIFSAALLLILCLFCYRYYTTFLMDSSINGSEVKEVYQHKIPHDVQKELDRKKQNNQLSEGIRVPILMYHYVEYVQDANDKTRIALNTPPFVLETQVKTLKEAGFTFMTASELAEVLERKTALPPHPVLLTFDDGYRDFYTYAYPILKKYNAKATQYVISGFLGYPNHLLPSQVQEIAKDSLVEIGAHTVHHVWLKGKSEKTAFHEVYQSKLDLEALIHKSVVSFAYPFGAFDLSAIQQVKDAGFTSSVSTIPGIIQKIDNRYFLYRIRPGGREGETLITFLNSVTYPTDKP
ncbi:MAG: polysaccharide deacetylase family protein [Candidatus Levyibacteriota bacterium]